MARDYRAWEKISSVEKFCPEQKRERCSEVQTMSEHVQKSVINFFI
jgi:hypothetical protein